ncbi:bridge-like lipid transfer protein family member 3B isoform X1 [Paramacrobiotus metropolitanus]|uniref:bridge-like lipid transfer protein family member 3B isoform X1 n=1 Tax=Paramacrobiotus metropolitanus TaxID=2943436 RepID=UPI0024458663|nr:bridge-like lipid transfer protein family member 3B isoform X1 [Paramacrobiotus metropolitanus]
MTSFVKTQLTNYLAKFIKNFERDQLKLSVTKGRFELTDLDFDEDLLTNLMELPTWLKVDRISCNRLYVKIGWRKIQSLPLHIHLDEVTVQMATCPELRTPTPPVSVFSMPDMPEMKYRLPHKILDGAIITMNKLRISFVTQLMKAEIELLQLRTYPSTPEWQQTDNIAKSRVKNQDLDETLIFRQLDFDSMKCELASTGDNENQSQPIALITSDDNVRIIMKRRLSDAAVLAVKIDNILEKIQLKLSETEMKSAVEFVRDIMALIEASTAQTRILKAQNKYVAKQKSSKTMDEFMKKHVGEEYNAQTEKRPHFKDAKARYFMRNTIWESSQHLLFKTIDLLIIHDNAMPESFPEYRQYKRYAGASMTFHIENLRADVYPFHLVSESANSWMARQHMVPGSEVWRSALLSGYRRELASVNSSLFEEDVKHLMSSTIVVGIGDMTIYPLITAKDVQCGNRPQELPFLSFQKTEFGLPSSIPAIELCRTQYYYAKQVQWPVPKASLFVSVSPMRIALDAKTVDWMTLMSLHVAFDLIKKLRSLELFMVGSPEPSTVKTLLRVEAYFPRIFFPKSFESEEGRRSGIQLQIASLVVSNTSVGQSKTVEEALPAILQTNLYAHPSFPPNMPADWSLPDLVQHIRSFYQDPARRPSMMFIQATDLWAGAVTEELGSSVPIPFVDAVPVQMWLVPGNFNVSQQRKLVWGAAVVCVDAPTLRVQLNDYILKLLKQVSEGLVRLGDVGAEHMAMLPQLGCPDLGLCLLMQQENVEVSVVLQSQYGQAISAGEALNISNLSIAKETAATMAESGSLRSLSLSQHRDSIDSTTSASDVNIPASAAALSAQQSAVQMARDNPVGVSPLTTITSSASIDSAATNRTNNTQPASLDNNAPWWKQAKYFRESDNESEDVFSEVSNLESASETGSAYDSDEESAAGSITGGSVVTDDSAWESELDLTEAERFNWKALANARKTLPLPDVPTSLFVATLKSLQTYLMISHGHVLAKLRLGQIVTAESRDVALREVPSVPLPEADLDVSRPEYLDSLLLRFERGKYALHGDAPGITAVCRGLDVPVQGKTFRRLMALLDEVQKAAAAQPSAPAAPPGRRRRGGRGVQRGAVHPEGRAHDQHPPDEHPLPAEGRHPAAGARGGRRHGDGRGRRQGSVAEVDRDQCAVQRRWTDLRQRRAR